MSAYQFDFITTAPPAGEIVTRAGRSTVGCIIDRLDGRVRIIPRIGLTAHQFNCLQQAAAYLWLHGRAGLNPAQWRFSEDLRGWLSEVHVREDATSAAATAEEVEQLEQLWSWRSREARQ